MIDQTKHKNNQKEINNKEINKKNNIINNDKKMNNNKKNNNNDKKIHDKNLLIKYIKDNELEKLKQQTLSIEKINQKLEEFNNGTLLHIACNYGKMDVILFLLEQGADVINIVYY